MYDHLVMLSMRIGGRAWTWEATYGPQNNPHTAPLLFWKQLHDYCWTVYSKALKATGVQAVGRIADLKNFKAKVCNIDTHKGETLLQAGTSGNALEMDKWSPVLNDAWILGGVHRGADFVLHSPRSFENLWENSVRKDDVHGELGRVGMVVTARELTGLVAFGYVRTTVPGGEVRYVCKNGAKARAADLLSYDKVIREAEARGPAEILQHMGLRDDVAHDIRTFDRSKLRPPQR